MTETNGGAADTKPFNHGVGCHGRRPHRPALVGACWRAVPKLFEQDARLGKAGARFTSRFCCLDGFGGTAVPVLVFRQCRRKFGRPVINPPLAVGNIPTPDWKFGIAAGLTLTAEGSSSRRAPPWTEACGAALAVSAGGRRYGRCHSCI
jgi:hypothetical protein